MIIYLMFGVCKWFECLGWEGLGFDGCVFGIVMWFYLSVLGLID